MDLHKNQYLSLAEVDKGVKDVMKLPNLFNLKPVLLRAFNTAKNKFKAVTQHGDENVSKAEFKYLLRYLRQYYEYWVAFDIIDKDDDKQVSLDEFTKAVPEM